MEPGKERAPFGYQRNFDEGVVRYMKAIRRAFLPPGNTVRDVVAFFENRASFHAVESWILGRRRPPQWAKDLVSAHVARRTSQLEAIDLAGRSFAASEPPTGKELRRYNASRFRER